MAKLHYFSDNPPFIDNKEFIPKLAKANML